MKCTHWNAIHIALSGDTPAWCWRLPFSKSDSSGRGFPINTIILTHVDMCCLDSSSMELSFHTTWKMKIGLFLAADLGKGEAALPHDSQNLCPRTAVFPESRSLGGHIHGGITKHLRRGVLWVSSVKGRKGMKLGTQMAEMVRGARCSLQGCQGREEEGNSWPWSPLDDCQGFRGTCEVQL